MNRSKICLLIDDDHDDQEIFMIALGSCGKPVSCLTADSGAMGLEQLDRDRTALPDYIFLDLNMPGMNGRQCLAEIRNRPFLNQVPVVIYSTSSHPKDMEETKALGANGFMTKPSSIKTLTQLLSDFFDSRA